MHKEPWKAAWQCRGCGEVLFGEDALINSVHPCPRCGTFLGQEKVAARIVTRGWLKRQYVEVKDQDMGAMPTEFHARLAKLLMVETEGDDSPGAVVAWAMREAAHTLPKD